jgi:hypothetical protein
MLDEHEQVVTVIAPGNEKSPIQVGALVGPRPLQFVKGLLIGTVIRKSDLPFSARATKVKVHDQAVMVGLPHGPICEIKNDKREQEIASHHNQEINVTTGESKFRFPVVG